MTAYKVYPGEVEATLLKHQGVSEAGVVGVPDRVQGERVVAFVIVRPGVGVTSEELIEFCSRDMAEYKVPSQIEFVDSLPKNAAGKVLRSELKQTVAP